MSITRADVADLQPGDVVELECREHPGTVITGPLHVVGKRLQVGTYIVRTEEGGQFFPFQADRTLTVVSRAPRPLYVNHDRTEPVSGDYARDEDADGIQLILRTRGQRFRDKWIDQDGIERTYDHIPGRRLRLLVDGETGQVVP